MHTVFFILVCCTSRYLASYISDDAYLEFPQLAEKYGQKCEEFDVITEDKYILKLFHVIGDPTKPLLMVHGVLDTPDTFVLRGNKSLAVTAASKGYDVWALSVRGNKYSRRHVTLNPDTDKEFWDFTLHEMGVKDLPATIDFILDKTKQTQLTYIGHSQGNQISFVLGSMVPEYNAKLKAIIALAPIAYLTHLPLPNSVLPKIWPPLSILFEVTGEEEFLKNGSVLAKGIHSLCQQEHIGYELCGLGVASAIMGPDPEELEEEYFPTLIQHYPAWTSRRNVDHLAQIALRKKFAQYDHGVLNVLKYGSLTPPDYPLKDITAQVYLLEGLNDRFADVKDVKALEAELPNPHYHVVDRELMNHLDFVQGKNMDVYLYPLLFDILEKVTETITEPVTEPVTDPITEPII